MLSLWSPEHIKEWTTFEFYTGIYRILKTQVSNKQMPTTKDCTSKWGINSICKILTAVPLLMRQSCFFFTHWITHVYETFIFGRALLVLMSLLIIGARLLFCICFCKHFNLSLLSTQKIDAQAIEEFYGLTSDISKNSESGYILFYQSRDWSPWW